MNLDNLEGKWEKIKGRLKEAWGDLTDTDMAKVQGTFHEAFAYLQEKYGETKEATQEKLTKLLEKIEKKIK